MGLIAAKNGHGRSRSRRRRPTGDVWLTPPKVLLVALVEGVFELGQLLVEVGGLAAGAGGRVIERHILHIRVQVQVQVVFEIVLRIIDALHVPLELRRTNR